MLAVVVAVGVLGGHGEVAPAPAHAPAARVATVASAVAVPSQALTAAVAAPVDPLAAAHAVDGQLGQTLIPYEWRPKLADRVDRFTIDDSVFALAIPPRRSDWPRAVASPYVR